MIDTLLVKNGFIFAAAERRKAMGTNGYLRGLCMGTLVGGLVGGTLGILYAPKKGKRIRADLCHSADNLLEEIKELTDQTTERIDRFIHH